MPGPLGVNEEARAATAPRNYGGLNLGAAVQTNSCACDRAAISRMALGRQRDTARRNLPACPRFAFPGAHPPSRCRTLHIAPFRRTTPAPRAARREFFLARRW